ncbi:neuferricin isoform X1 [Thalassophryne amazonica]|uniref:neuferricin isoform X1 n=1 Tax=Thalassophryne amazonica TaxID=390379 RepID=UPI0014712BAB|nr:neuferricin isoform X1 [Thalassophryne amazonica]
MLSHVLFFLSVLLAVLLIPRDWFGNKSLRLLTTRELSLYDGEVTSKGLYLAILGHVFDVQKGYKHYGPGGAYHLMAGKDASLAFITGDFTEGSLTDDVSSLSPVQVVALYDWLAFYQREYHPVGRLIGRFYTESGQPTEALLQLEVLLAESQQITAQTQAQRLQTPACNSEWSAATGGRVWCSSKSGGVERDWTGVPRKLFSPGSSSTRCVCVKMQSAGEENPNLQEYEGCPPHAESCPLEDSEE